MKSKTYILVVFLAFNFHCLYSQFSEVKEDFGVWNRAGLSYKISKKWQVKADYALRLKDNATELRTSFVQVAINRDLPKKWEAAMKVRYSYKLNKQSSRISGEVKKSIRLKPINVKFRSKIDLDYDLSGADDPLEPRWRNRVGLEYKKKKYKLSGGVSIEWFHEYDDSLNLPENIRGKAGLSYDLNKRLSIGTNLLIQEERNVANPDRDYVLQWNIEYSLSK